MFSWIRVGWLEACCLLDGCRGDGIGFIYQRQRRELVLTPTWTRMDLHRRRQHVKPGRLRLGDEERRLQVQDGNMFDLVVLRIIPPRGVSPATQELVSCLMSRAGTRKTPWAKAWRGWHEMDPSLPRRVLPGRFRAVISLGQLYQWKQPRLA